MAISDEVFTIGLAILFIYLVIYRRNRLVGSILFMLTGVALASFTTGTINTSVGAIITIGSLISLIYSLFEKGRIHSKNRKL